MPNNYIVLRNSPDWLSYTDQQSRDFCARFALPESTILDFISIWDAAFDVDYRHFRHVMKDTALANFAKVHGSIFIEHADFRSLALEADDLAVFVDDDDWLASDLFMRLRDVSDGHGHDGMKWGSVRVGPEFSALPQTQTLGVLYPRPIDQILYTNNYAVTGRALLHVGIERLFEHRDAQQQFDAGAYRPQTVSQYLSAANKHPCSTMAALFFLNFEPFRRDPRTEISRFADALTQSSLDPNTRWIAEPLRTLHSLVEAAIGRSSGATRQRFIA
jgi:hypothetical protein